MNPLLSLLAKYLNEQGDVTGPLSFDDKITADIKASARTFASDDLDVFVSALDVGDQTKVERLDVPSAEFLYFVLTQSEACLAQQRGLYLLAAAIHTELSDEQVLKSHKFVTRRALKPRLSVLLKLFDGNSGHPELTRRYAAVLALEILSGSKMGANTLSHLQRKELYPLGQTLTTAPSYGLRQLAGLLIHRLDILGVPAKSFFASTGLAESFSKNVPNLPANSKMLGGLADFLGECSDHGSLPVAFTSHVTMGKKSFIVDGQAGIMISVSEDLGILSIHIPPLPDTTALYIDVPLESAEVHNVRLSNEKKAQKKYVIQISLKSTSQASFCINESPEHAQRLSLGYTSRKSADDAYSILKSMLNESASPTEISKLSLAEHLNVSCSRMPYSSTSRGESEISAEIRRRSEARFEHIEPRVAVDKPELQSESQSDEDLVDLVSEFSAPGSTVHDMDSAGVYGETASEITDQDRNEMRGIARSALHHHDQHSDSNEREDSHQVPANYAGSNSPKSGEERAESQLSRSRREKPSRLENQGPIESSQTTATHEASYDRNHLRRSPRIQQKASPDPALVKKSTQSKSLGKKTHKSLQIPASSTKAAFKNHNGVKTVVPHAKQPVSVDAGDSDEMWNEGLDIEAEAEAGPVKIPEQARPEKTGKGNAATRRGGAATASSKNANKVNANIGRARTGTMQKGERPPADSAQAITLPTRSKRAAATQAKRKIEDQASSEEASHDDLLSSSWEPEAEKKRVRKPMPKKTSNLKHNSKIKTYHSRSREHKAKAVPVLTSTVDHGQEWELQDNADSDHSSHHNSPEIQVEDSAQVIQATAFNKMIVPLVTKTSSSQDGSQVLDQEEHQQNPLQTQRSAALAKTTPPSLKSTLQAQGRNSRPYHDSDAITISKEPSCRSSAIDETSTHGGQYTHGNRGPGSKHMQEEATQKRLKDPFNDRLRRLLWDSRQTTDKSAVKKVSSRVKAFEPLNHQETTKNHSDQQDRDHRLSGSAQYRRGSRPMMQEQITSSTGKRKATTTEAPPAKRKKAAIVERASNTRLRDDQIIRPMTPRTKSQRKAPMIHFGKSGPQNSGLLKVLNRKGDKPVVQGPPRTPLAATAGNIKSTLNSSNQVLPCKETRETANDSANLPPCGESTPERQPPRVGSQTMIADNGSPILVGDADGASVQDENSPPKEEQTSITPGEHLDNRSNADAVQADHPVTPAKDTAYPRRPRKRAKVNEQTDGQKAIPNMPLSESKGRDLDKHAMKSNGHFVNLHTQKPVIPIEAQNPFGSDGPARNTAFMNRLYASNDRLKKPSVAHRQEVERANEKAENRASLAHKLLLMPEYPNKTPVGSSRPLQRRGCNERRRQDSMKPVAMVQSGNQAEATSQKLPLWEDADATLVEREPHLHRRKHTSRRRDDTDTSDSSDEPSSSSSTPEDPDLLKQSGGREPHQQKVYSALMEVVKQIDKDQRCKEARIMEEVHHFQAYGEALVQGFTKQCQAQLQSNEERLKRAAKAQVELFEEAVQNISKDSEKIINNSVKDVEKDWRKEQADLFAGIEAVMAECEE